LFGYEGITTSYDKCGNSEGPGRHVALPNMGREGGTFLTHIVSNYDKLAEWTVFTQGEPPTWGYRGHRAGGGHMQKNARFQDYVEAHANRGKTPYYFIFTTAISLAVGTGTVDRLWTGFRAGWGQGYTDGRPSTHPGQCPNDGWAEWWLFPESFLGMIKGLQQKQPHRGVTAFDPKRNNPALFDIAPAHGTLYFAQGARFAASSEAIRSRPKAYYQKLLEAMSVDSDPWMGYYLEWVWYYVLGGDAAPCGMDHAEGVLARAQTEESADLQQRSERAKALHARWRAGGCEDTPGWTNTNPGGTPVGCKVYLAEGWCGHGEVKKSWATGPDFNFPEDNCCICGGGIQSKTAAKKAAAAAAAAR
jgi:hypothetical protein